MYGVEIWGCSRHLEPIEQVQLRALRMFFGVGTLHPKASLLREVEALPVVWEAKMRCVKFWLKVLNNEMYEGRLLRKIARQEVECGKGVWVQSALHAFNSSLLASPDEVSRVSTLGHPVLGRISLKDRCRIAVMGNTRHSRLLEEVV